MGYKKMGGGLMQLVAYGAQDIYLTGNPQITFFKVVYRRHTNFSMESIEQTFNGNPDFGRKVVCTISRNGDLIHRVYLQVGLPGVVMTEDAYFRWVNWVGHALVKNVEVEIGGQRPKVTLFIPLQFWFCRNPGLALPLIALQYHEVRINIEFRTFNELCGFSAAPAAVSLKAASLYVDYIYLDTDE